jgi:hypothetical protein
METALSGDNSPTYGLIQHAGGAPKAHSRFFPEFGADPTGAALGFLEEIDPFDPLDAGVAVGLNSWLRTVVATSPKTYGRSFDTVRLEDVRRQSPIFLIVALPVIVKGVGVAAASAGAVLAAVDRYYSIKERKARIEKADVEREANAKKTEAETRLVEQQAVEVEERTKLIRSQIREHQEFDRRVLANDLAEGIADVPPGLEKAAAVGSNLGAMAIYELERNPSVIQVRRDGPSREFR